MLLCALTAGAAAQPAPEPQPVVSGRTLGEKDQPVRKVSLTLLPLGTNISDEPLAPYGMTSDNAGRFEFYGVPPGQYRLVSERTGYLKTYYGAHNTWAGGVVLTLQAGEPLTNLTVLMVEESAISGTVIADEGAAEVWVRLLQQRYQNGRRQWVQVASVTCDSRGVFRMNKLAPGRYRLAAGALRWETPRAAGQSPARESVTYYPSVADLASAEPLDLRRGQTISDLRLPLLKAPLVTVSGTIPRKSPDADGLQIQLSSVDLGILYGTVVTGDTFRVESVAPGSYYLRAAEMRGAAVRLVAQQPVEVPARDIEGITLDLDPSVGLQGTVRFAGNVPADAKLRVRLALAEAGRVYYKQAEVKVDGTFTIQGHFLGTYSFDVQGLPVGAYIKSAVYGGKDALGELNLARTGGDEKLEIVVGANAARISGVVRDEKGKALDGVVTLIPDPPQPQQTLLYRLAETDEYGRFQFQGLRPGKYRLYAWEEFEAGAQFDPDVTAPFQARSLAVEVAEGERKEVEVARISADENGR